MKNSFLMIYGFPGELCPLHHSAEHFPSERAYMETFLIIFSGGIDMCICRLKWKPVKRSRSREIAGELNYEM